ncbi:MAG: HTH-type transcriptional repressor RspR [Proteobacteria bacterium]|nr:MAG: HTH-type transcriptional repressor RspR [Pseudomonadota bacterium]
MANTVSNLDEKVRESLRGRIVSGDLSGGAHLSELKLSKEFNVSRTPIREALCALAADGLIEMVPHRGAFVKTFTADEQQDTQFVYSQLISLATRTAVERAGIETLMDLETSISGMPTTSTTEFVTYAEGIISAIRNISASPALDKAITAVERGMTTAPMWLNDGSSMEQIKQEFTYLLGAFKRQKADAAEKTMRQIMSLFNQVETTETDIDMAATATTVQNQGLNA